MKSALPVLAALSMLPAACASPPRTPAVSAGLSAAGASPRAFDPGPLEIGEHVFRRRVLPNGLRALAARDASEPTVSVFVVYAVGSGVESPAETGLAHLVEHAMYAGTTRTPAGEHDAIVKGLGGESNAYTRQDYTLYYDHRVPADALRRVLDLEADRMRGLAFEREAVLHERYRLEVEERSSYSAGAARHELVESVVLRNHPYAAGVRAGENTMAPTLSVDRVKAFYDAWYHAGRAAVVIVGDVEPERALDAVAGAFGALPAGPPAPPMPREPEGALGGEARFASDLTDERVVHAWVGPALEEPGEGARPRLALELLARLLESQEAGAEVSAELGGGFARDLFVLAATGGGADERLARALEAVPRLVRDAELLERAKANARDDVLALELRARPYFSLGSLAGVYAAHGREDVLARRAVEIDALDGGAVLAAAREWLAPERRWTVRFLPGDDAGAPDELPDDPRELQALAERADASGDLELAIAAYEKLLTTSPNRMDEVIYLYDLGDLRMRAGDLERSLATLERALDVVDYPAVRELRDDVARRMEEGASAGEEAVEPQPAEASAPGSEDARPERPPSGRGVAWEEGLDPALAAEAERLMAWIEDWRALPFLEDLFVEVVPPEEADEKLKGWYEPANDRLVVVSGGGEDFARGTLLHEMVHALQDQHFDLEALRARTEGEDAHRALSALIEGEAMLAVSELMDYDFEQHAKVPPEGDLDEARFEKIFLYGAGLRFVRALREAGGWQQVDAAWASPPRSTAQILHPSRALAGWRPRALDATEWMAEGAAPSSAAPRGEYELALFLSRGEETRSRAFALASRLAGDLELRWEGDGDDARAEWVLAVFDGIAAERLARAFAELGVEARVAEDGTALRVPLPAAAGG